MRFLTPEGSHEARLLPVGHPDIVPIPEPTQRLNDLVHTGEAVFVRLRVRFDGVLFASYASAKCGLIPLNERTAKDVVIDLGREVISHCGVWKTGEVFRVSARLNMRKDTQTCRFLGGCGATPWEAILDTFKAYTSRISLSA
jgi:hypothetical protein